jgi:acyl-CoA reductase-like NAD-dependent aldehyde dehydrogenase
VNSEVAPHTAAKLTELVPKFVDSECVQFVNGDKDVVTELLQHPFGHIIYTGNGTIGSIVMAAAAKHLTPVTLELGGKSPVIVSNKANIALAAKRVAWGKFFNAGQTCMCPDYALVQEDVMPQFLEELKKVTDILSCLKSIRNRC